MVRFAHLADVHLGGWKQKPLQDLNFESFKKTVDICLASNLDFVLVAGDLFDSAFPPIEILKETFGQFKRLKEANIPVFLIAGSHDYSASGKTFLDVLEKAGFCKNVHDSEENEDSILLNPTVHKGVAIYGYPGKRSGLEVNDLRKVKLQDAPGMFKIFMLHTTIDRVKGSLPIDSVISSELPKSDYYALGHIHIDYARDGFVYPGPLYPNNFQELEDARYGGFYIVDTSMRNPLEKVDLKIKDVYSLKVDVSDATTATDEIILKISQSPIENKILLLRIRGELKNGRQSDIKFQKIEEYAKNKGAYFILRNTHELSVADAETEIEIKDSENVEEETFKAYTEKNPSNFNDVIPSLINALAIEKQEDEKTDTFNNRIIEEARKILNF